MSVTGAVSPFQEDEATFFGWRLPWWFPIPGVPRGRWVVLVAGFDYERKGVDFEKIALSRMRLLIRRNIAAQKNLGTSFSSVVDTAPRFVLFDFRSGVVRTSVASQPDGKRAWKEIARFQPVSASNYSAGGHAFDTDQAGRMSVTDVYDHLRMLGTTEPGSVAELSFLSHGWVGGPILVNSFDGSAAGVDTRDPNDKDPRTEKDFIAPTMDAPALAEFRAAFGSDAFVWVWGCSFANSPRQVLYRVLSSAKYKGTAAGKLVNTDTFRLTFPRDHAELFFDVDPVFFPVRGADGQFPLTFDRTLQQVKDFFFGRLSQTYCNALAQAAQVPCFGALPGTYSDYERDVADPVMVVPTSRPPYADDFTRSIRFYTTYVGSTLDPEVRSYGRFDP
ncbi:MAG TPA: hypothetical protein VFT35_05710 [Gaiellaceae bacterium]|nr:hypothetical protein [Gaiellaceae bacterium]